MDSEYQIEIDDEDGEDFKKEEVNPEKVKDDARIAAQEEYEKIQEQYRKLLVRQQQEIQVCDF